VRKLLPFLLLLLPAIAHAQPTVDAGKAFKVILNHDGANVTDYQITIDPPGTTAPNIVRTLLVAARDTTTGDVTFDVPAQTLAGAYTVVGCARNVDPAGVATTGTKCTSAVPFNVVVPTMPVPTAPTLRIGGTISIAGGPPQPFTADVVSLTLVVK